MKTGIVSSDTGDFFNRIFEDRHKGDYMDFAQFTSEQIEENYEYCQKYITEIRAKIYEIMGWSFDEK